METGGSLQQVAHELGIELAADETRTSAQIQAEQSSRLRTTMDRVAGELSMHQTAKRAVNELTPLHGELFAEALTTLAEQISRLKREYAELRLDFVERLTPLAEEALPQTRYPWVFAHNKACGYGDAGTMSLRLGQANEWCDKRADIDPWTIASIQFPWQDDSPTQSIHEISSSELLKIEKWLNDRVLSRRIAAERKAAKAARQKALRAVNKERKAGGLDPLPDPDTKAGREQIVQAGRSYSSLRGRSTSLDFLKRASETEIAEAVAAAEAAKRALNLVVVGNEAGDPPHELYVTEHEIRFGRG